MTSSGKKPDIVIMAAVSRPINGVPRQLLEIGGEKLLYRAIRLLKERGLDPYITVPSLGYYGDTGCREIIGKDSSGMGRFLNFKEHLKDCAYFFYGDVYYTPNAIDTILKDENEWRLFGRAQASSVGGKSWGEPFAFKVNKYIMEKAEEMKGRRKELGLAKDIEWDLYRYLNDYPVNVHYVKDNFTEINDFTDDIDRVADYEKLKKRAETCGRLVVIYGLTL